MWLKIIIRYIAIICAFNIITVMLRHESEPLSQDNNSNYHFISSLRAEYARQMIRLTHRKEGRGIEAAYRIYAQHQEKGKVASIDSLFLYGGSFGEIMGGVRAFMGTQLIAGKLSSLIDRFVSSEFEPVIVTSGLEEETVNMRSAFPAEIDGCVAEECYKGIIDGWTSTLDFFSGEIPLVLYRKEQKDYLLSHSVSTNPREIILPTNMPGINSRYEYSSNFSFPVVTLEFGNTC